MTPGEPDLAPANLLYRRALSLEYFTVGWCAMEVVVALAAGVRAEALLWLHSAWTA